MKKPDTVRPENLLIEMSRSHITIQGPKVVRFTLCVGKLLNEKLLCPGVIQQVTERKFKSCCLIRGSSLSPFIDIVGGFGPRKKTI